MSATATEYFAWLLSHFDTGREGRTGERNALVQCPGHDDNKASLSITLADDDDKILVHCFAGCATADLLEAKGLTMGYLWVGGPDENQDLWDALEPTGQITKPSWWPENETSGKGKSKKHAPTTEQPPPVNLELLRVQAQPVLELDDPLVAIREAIKAQGYGGSLDPPVIVYIACTTRLLAQRTGSAPCHLLIIATSGGGKTYTEKLVCLLLPESAVHRMTAGSARALIYDKGPLDHRTLLFGEADSLPSDEENPAASAIRALLQDNELSYDVVVKDARGGGYSTKKIRRPGPTQFVTTSTRRFRDHQMATRVLELEVPTDAQKVRAALAVQARLTNHPAVAPEQALVDFQAYLQAKAPWDVAVPFAEALAELIGRQKHDPRIMRDFSKILALVKAVAVIRHSRREIDEQGRVVATLEDYATIHGLIGAMYESAVTGASEGVRMVVAAVQAGAKTQPAVLETVGKLAPSEPSRASVYRWIDVAIRREWLRNEESNAKRPKILAPGELIPDRVALPAPDEVLSHVRCSTGGMSLIQAEGVDITGTCEDSSPSYGRGVRHETRAESGNEIEGIGVSHPRLTPNVSHETGETVRQPSSPPAGAFCSTCRRFRCACSPASPSKIPGASSPTEVQE
jgi:hypothetical protein